MYANRFFRRAAAAALMSGATMLPSALDASCSEKLVNSSDHGWVQEITCCGSTACCTTTWNGSTLVDQVCRP